MACIGYCEENGLTPHWHCWDENDGSIAVAESIGFGKAKKYDVYRFDLG
jgi:RimJ/RimL family protein N-acetyltransferase